MKDYMLSKEKIAELLKTNRLFEFMITEDIK